MRFYTETAQALLRNRSARENHVRLHPRSGGPRCSSIAICPPTRSSSCEPIAPYRDDLVVAVECIFTWYWLADLCARGGYPLRPRPRPLHEGHPRGQGQERQDRLQEDSWAVASEQEFHAPRVRKSQAQWRQTPIAETMSRAPIASRTAFCQRGQSNQSLCATKTPGRAKKYRAKNPAPRSAV